MVELAKKPDQHEAMGLPSAWVARFAGLIPAGEALDLACGAGRHCRLLAAQGRPVLAVDRSEDMLALAAGDSVRTMCIDLETGDSAQSWPFETNSFAGIVVTNYLHRPLWPFLVDCLAENGVLIYETFARGNEQFGKPSNPDFLLARGELLDVAREYGLQVVAYEDGYVAAPKPAMVQRICMIKPGKDAPAKIFALN